MPSLVSVEQWGDFSKSSPPDNAQTLLDAASASIRNYCGWNITREVVTDRVLDSYGTTVVIVPTLLLLSIESLYEYDTYLEEFADYRWSRNGMVRRRPRHKRWPNEYGCIRISYTHGYDECPADVAALCVNIAKRSDVVPTGLLQKQVGGISMQFKDTNLSEAEMAVLNPYALESGRNN